MAKPRVLIVDGSQFGVELIRDYLKQSPLQIFTANDSDEALSLASRVQPNLVVVDEFLPGIGGISLCRALKKDLDLGPVSVILLAAPGEKSAEGLEADFCDAVLPKPVKRRDFLERARLFLDRIDRREPRILCRATVACCVGGETFYGTIEDISPHGMFVGTIRPMQKGEFLVMKFLLPWQEAHLMETEARVAWANAVHTHRKTVRPQGFGVEFVNPPQEVVDGINGFLQHSILRQVQIEE